MVKAKVMNLGLGSHENATVNASDSNADAG
jgi:hypothetical protein